MTLIPIRLQQTRYLVGAQNARHISVLNGFALEATAICVKGIKMSTLHWNQSSSKAKKDISGAPWLTVIAHKQAMLQCV